MHPIVRYARRSCFVIILCLVAARLVAPLHAAGSNVERTAAFSAPEASSDLKKAIEDKGYRVVLDDGWRAEFWFASALATATKESAGALYPELTNGEFVGVVSYSKGTTDYRGQTIPPGSYTLRYQYLPQDANHMGVSPNPDFLLAIPLVADPDLAAVLPYKKLVALSAKTTGTAHPAVIAMAVAGTPVQCGKRRPRDDHSHGRSAHCRIGKDRKAWNRAQRAGDAVARRGFETCHALPSVTRTENILCESCSRCRLNGR